MRSCVGSKEKIISCESQVELRARIKCRFENPEIARDELRYRLQDDDCRRNTHRDYNELDMDCLRFYEKSAYCYKLETSELKKSCLLEKSGINFEAKKSFEEFREEEKRNYIILLLHDLQKK
ncbi:hypothetical protein FJZ21_03780 [Candidatus Pacearchaeota archaeon]|nr:hypothetical protein [Candidatus Pacearchaeota archaeon]